MLSRYNGIGSLKLSIGAANKRRTSNPYISDVMRTDIDGHHNDKTDSTYADLPIQCSPTPVTNNSIRKLGKFNHSKKDINDLNAKTQFNLSRKSSKIQQKHDSIHTIEANTMAHGRKLKCIPKITSTNSIYSTSTTSNLSLQEYDDNELDPNELAVYMRQIKNEINHDAK